MHKQWYLEISFSGHQNAENEQNETLNKQVQKWRFLSKVDYALQYVSFKHKGQMNSLKFYTLHHDNNLPNIENIYYNLYIGKGIDVEISRFQFTKTLKMNIRKHSTKKDRTNDSFNIWIRPHCTIASLFLSSWQNEAFYISYFISR